MKEDEKTCTKVCSTLKKLFIGQDKLDPIINRAIVSCTYFQVNYYFYVKIIKSLNIIVLFSKNNICKVPISLFQVEIIHLNSSIVGANGIIQFGMDLGAFYKSFEWDVIAVPARYQFTTTVCLITKKFVILK